MADPKGSTPEEGSYVPSAPVPSPLTPEQKKQEDKKRLEMQGVKPEGRSLTEDSPFDPPGWTPDQIQPDTELSKQEDWRKFKQEQEDFAQLSGETQEKKDKQERIDYLAGLPLSERAMDWALEAAKVAIPIVTEIAAPLGAGIAFSPLLAGGPPGIAAYFTILGGSGFGSNALAQKMRIGYGQKEKFSWEESIAATAFSAIPGFGVPARMSKVAFRAGQGAVMATGEAATRQTLEMGSGEREWGDFDTMELVFAATIGTAVGGGLGKLEVVLDVKPRAGETPEEAMRRGFREGEKQTRLDIKEAKRHASKRDINEQERALRNEEVKQRESILEDMVNTRKDFESKAGQLANEGEILEQAVEQIRKQQDEVAENFESLAKDIETGSTTPVDGVDAPTVYHRGDRNQPNREEGLINLTDDADAATNYALGGNMDEATHFSPEGEARLNEAKKNTKSYEVDAKNTLDLKNDPEAGAILKGLDAQGNKDAEKIIAYDDLYWWKNTQPHMQEAWKNIIIPQLKALGYDSIKYQDDLHETLAVFGGKQLKEITKQAEPTAPKATEESFNELAQLQRGLPEEQMRKIQHLTGGGVLDTVVEHGGDLVNRISKISHKGGYEYASAKIRNVHDVLTNEYGFEKELLDNLKYKAESDKIPFDDALQNLKKELKQFAEEHKKLPAYNEAHKAIRDFNVAVGEWRFADAEKILTHLKKKLDGGEEAWNKWALEGLDPATKQAEPTAPFSPSERAIPDEQGKVTPERLERVLKKFLTKDKGHEGGESGDTLASGLLPESDVSPKISELTDDTELQGFLQMIYDELGVEFAGTAKAKRKAKVPRKVVTAEDFMEKAKDAIRLIGGDDEVAKFELLQKQALTSDTTGAQLEELGVRGAAYAALTSHGMRRVINNIKSTDWETSDAALNDAVVDIYKLFAGPYMGYKRVTTAHGRNLRSTQYMKDVLELDIKDVSKAMEEKFIGDLKKSGDLTPEAMQKQIDSLGEISVVKKLLAALQQSQDLEEAADILIKQQKAFQNHQTITRNLASGAELPSVYRKISDMTVDMLYSSMLSSPITHWKAKIGNTFMQYYQPFQGMLGGTYMAHAPWARRGVSKQEWLEAAKFWKDTATGYGMHNELAKQEAWRAFSTGQSDITSHFERIGLSAFGMDRTGLSGRLGQALENMGKFVDIPGRNMQRIDMFSKQRIAHSMFAADTHRQFVKEHGRAPSDLEFEAAWKARKERVFTEDLKIKDKDVVKREAVLASKEQNIPAEDLPMFIEKYVEKNWNASEERFVEYVKRNVKEVAFQDNPGEYGTAVSPVEKSLLGGEKFIKELPFIGPELTATLFPFMRTGRNILREGYSSGTAWMSSIPGTRRISDKLWTKTLADLDSPDPVIAARAKGKQIVSAAILVGMIDAVRRGHFVGTERPEDWRLQENLETATGQRADEIRMVVTMDDVKHELGVDAAALEPLLTVAQVVANTQSSWHYLRKEDQSVLTSMFMSAVMANAKMIESKSYYANVSKLMKMTEALGKEGNTRYMSRTGRSLFKAGVPSGVNALNTMTDNKRRSQDFKDMEGLLQVLGNRMPGISNQNPVYRDMFGDEVSRHSESPKDKTTKAAQLISPVNPFSWSIKRFDKDEYTKTDDYGFRRLDVSKVNLKDPEEVRNAAWAITTELDITGGFNGGTSVLTSYSESGVSAPLNIDLTGLKYEGIETPNSPKIGQDAFDRWQQIYSTLKDKSGRTVKEAIVKFGKHKNFKKIPTIEKSQIRDEDVRMGNDPRKTEVMKIMKMYEKAALHQLVKEYPRLRKSALNSLKSNKKREQGFGIEATTTDTEELQQLLNN